MAGDGLDGRQVTAQLAQDRGRRVAQAVQRAVVRQGGGPDADFYKSMTGYNDHTQWQDVYRKDTDYGERLYIKFTAGIVTDFIILSFKERD